MRLAKVRSPVELLGFYHGVPQTKRTHNYGLIPPDKIIIYQRPIEMRCRTMEQVRTTINRVLRHEIGHSGRLRDTDSKGTTPLPTRIKRASKAPAGDCDDIPRTRALFQDRRPAAAGVWLVNNEENKVTTQKKRRQNYYA